MCRLDILKGKPGYMVEEHHGQPIVYDEKKQRTDDRVSEHIGKRPHGQRISSQWSQSAMQL